MGVSIQVIRDLFVRPSTPAPREEVHVSCMYGYEAFITPRRRLAA